MAKNFTSEDDLSTFEGWLKYQGVDAAAVAPDDLRGWRDHFENYPRAYLGYAQAWADEVPTNGSG